MKHGWVVRGNMEDPDTAKEIAIALKYIEDFFLKHLA